MTFGLHTIYTMTIRRYVEMEQTERISLLKLWWNPFPVKWFDTMPFFDDVAKIFGSKTRVMSTDIFKIKSYNKIMALSEVVKTLYLLFRDYEQRKIIGKVFDKDVKKTKNFNYFIEYIKKYTGIDVKKVGDLQRVEKEIQRQVDKYIERFNEKPQTVNFIDIVLGVFAVMEMSYNPGMTLLEFSRLKDLALKKNKDGKRI